MLTSDFAGRQKLSSETSRVGRSLVTLARRRNHTDALRRDALASWSDRLRSQQDAIADKLKAIQEQLPPAAAASPAPLETAPQLRVVGVPGGVG